jgi:hypothetical protein
MRRTRRTRRTRLAGVLASTALATTLVGAPALADSHEVPPRPGCGFGDTNHSHQAAPGRDPMGLRPGHGYGDPNHEHTAPPGQMAAGQGAQDDPRRGCPDDPRP